MGRNDSQRHHLTVVVERSRADTHCTLPRRDLPASVRVHDQGKLRERQMTFDVTDNGCLTPTVSGEVSELSGITCLDEPTQRKLETGMNSHREDHCGTSSR